MPAACTLVFSGDLHSIVGELRHPFIEQMPLSPRQNRLSFPSVSCDAKQVSCEKKVLRKGDSDVKLVAGLSELTIGIAEEDGAVVMIARQETHLRQ